MAPALEVDTKKRELSHHQKGPLCCALPALPTLPKLPHFKELEGCVSAITHLHSVLSNALDNLKLALLSNLRDAGMQHPHLLRLLPPTILASCYPQMRDHTKRRHELAAYDFAAVLPGDSVAALVVSNGILNFLNIYNTLLVVRLILTWFPEPPQVIVNPLSTICDPYLNIFRGIIPPLGGTIDLSPILAFLVLNVFTNSAAALPAELPPAVAAGAEASQSVRKQPLSIAGPTQAQKAWLRRLAGSLEARKASI